MFNRLWWIALRMAFLGVLLGLAAAGYAATRANTVPPTQSGDGSTAISNYTLNTASIAYTLSSTDPQDIASVSFSFSGTTVPTSSSTVKAQFSNSGSTWYSCSGGPPTWTCTTTGATVTSGMSLTVVAAN